MKKFEVVYTSLETDNMVTVFNSQCDTREDAQEIANLMNSSYPTLNYIVVDYIEE